MGSRQSRPGFVQRLLALEESVRTMRIADRSHCETKTWTIGMDTVDDTTTIPRALLNVNPLEGNREWKRIVSVHGITETGDLTVDLAISPAGGSPTVVYTGLTFDDLGNDQDVAGTVEFDGPVWLRATVTGGSASFPSIALTIVTGRR